MRRRDFVALVGCVATGAGWPFTACALRQSWVYRIAMMVQVGRLSPPMEAFFYEMSQAGFV